MNKTVERLGDLLDTRLQKTCVKFESRLAIKKGEGVHDPCSTFKVRKTCDGDYVDWMVKIFSDFWCNRNWLSDSRAEI
jgi:hypothetical protein